MMLTVPQVYAVSNAAGTSHALRGTKNPADGNTNCASSQCILMSSDGAANNDDHGIFIKVTIPFHICYAPGGGLNGGEFVDLTTPITTSTAISTLTWTKMVFTAPCGASQANTWQIFHTTKGNTIWAVKLDSSGNFPATLDSTNFNECDPAGNFDMTNGCDPFTDSGDDPPPIAVPSGLNLSIQPEIITDEIDFK